MGTFAADPPELAAYTNEELRAYLDQARIDLRLAEGDPERAQQAAALLDAALGEHMRRLDAHYGGSA